MSDATDLAAQIDAMTLDELMAKATDGDLPLAGGDHDTKGGWAERLGMDQKSRNFRKLWDYLEAAGLIEIRKGRIKRDGHDYRRPLFYSPTLARKCEG